VTTERPLAEDTPLAVERLQIEIWRRMTPAEKFAQLEDMHASAILFTEAGLRRRHPRASAEELRMRRLAITLGNDTVRTLYGFDVGAQP
jgi:hypothetical protein